MEPIDEVSEFGRDIPGLLHSVVIHVVRTREQLQLDPHDNRVIRLTRIEPARTRLFMIRAALPDNSGTISFEDDLEEILMLQHQCGMTMLLKTINSSFIALVFMPRLVWMVYNCQ